MLARHDLRPYAVHLRVAGLAGSPRVEPEQASPAFLERARNKGLDLVLHTLCERGGIPPRLQVDLAGPDSAANVRLLRAMLTRVELSRRSLPELRADSPLIHGIKVVGPITTIENLIEDPLIAQVEPGIRRPIGGAERLVVPDPSHPGEPLTPETIPWIEALEPSELRNRMETLVEEQPVECRAWNERREELRQERLRQRRGVPPETVTAPRPPRV